MSNDFWFGLVVGQWYVLLVLVIHGAWRNR